MIGNLVERIMIGVANQYYEYKHRKVLKKRNKYIWKPRSISKICLYYRICEQGFIKEKADYITKENCLANAVACFPTSEVEWHVLADNVNASTYQMILKYLPPEAIQRVSVGHGAGTFRIVYDEALRQDDDSLIYFLEDDYLHCASALQYLRKVASSGCCDYITLYDHPDKYQTDSLNPYVYDGGEETKVIFTGNHHWKETNSTTMTFAAFVKTLKEDKNHFWRWTGTKYPYDFYIFEELRKCAGRKLLSPIPSLSTHGEIKYLALGVDWEACAKNCYVK